MACPVPWPCPSGPGCIGPQGLSAPLCGSSRFLATWALCGRHDEVVGIAAVSQKCAQLLTDCHPGLSRLHLQSVGWSLALCTSASWHQLVPRDSALHLLARPISICVSVSSVCHTRVFHASYLCHTRVFFRILCVSSGCGSCLSPHVPYVSVFLRTPAVSPCICVSVRSRSVFRGASSAVSTFCVSHPPSSLPVSNTRTPSRPTRGRGSPGSVSAQSSRSYREPAAGVELTGPCSRISETSPTWRDKSSRTQRHGHTAPPHHTRHTDTRVRNHKWVCQGSLLARALHGHFHLWPCAHSPSSGHSCHLTGTEQGHMRVHVVCMQPCPHT